MAENRVKEEMSAKKGVIGQSVRFAKAVSDLPKNENWRFDPDYIRNLIEKLLNLCEENGIIPTQNLIASALGEHRDKEAEVRFERVPAHPEVVYMLKEYFKLCENVTIQASLDGSANYISTIFLMKSIYGYQEQPKEVIITHNYNKLLGDRKDPEAIAARYAESVVIDVDESELKEIDENAIPDMAALPPGVRDPKRKGVLVSPEGEVIDGLQDDRN